MIPKAKYYVVWKGRKNRGFLELERNAEAQVKGFYRPHSYKSFTSRAAAEQALRGKYSVQVGKPAPTGNGCSPPIRRSRKRLRGRSLFRQSRAAGIPRRGPADRERDISPGPYQNGTNNVGEFPGDRACAQAAKKEGSKLPIYSDSSTGIGWVKKKRSNTELAVDERNAPLSN